MHQLRYHHSRSPPAPTSRTPSSSAPAAAASHNSRNMLQQQQQAANRRWYFFFLFSISLMLVGFILLIRWRFSHVFDADHTGRHKHRSLGPAPDFVFHDHDVNPHADVDDRFVSHDVAFVHRGPGPAKSVLNKNTRQQQQNNHVSKKQNTTLRSGPPRLSSSFLPLRRAAAFFSPQRRSAVDNSTLDCDAAKILHDQRNKQSEDKDRTSVLPCVRVLLFSTLKPCTSDDAIWTQFAAVSSWGAALVYPSVTVVLYDTSLRKRGDDGDSNDPTTTSEKSFGGRGKNTHLHRHANDEKQPENKKEEEEDDENIVHQHFDEAEHVVKFAAANDIDLSDGADIDEEVLRDGGNPRHHNPTPRSVRRSCAWLLAKMVEKFFNPTTVVEKSKFTDRVLLNTSVYPRVAVVAPTDHLVGPHHNTLLLSRALRHLTNTVAPQLRPSGDRGVFDVYGFVNSDIIFGETFGPLVSNAFRLMRSFMLVGRRQSLSIDELRSAIRHGFVSRVDEQKQKSKAIFGDDSVAEAEMVGRQSQQQHAIWPGASFYKTFFYDPRSSMLGRSNPSLLHLISEQQHNKKGGRKKDRIDAEDYFFWTRGFLSRPTFPWSIPPFHIGRPAFDNWLVSNSIHSMQPVVDATDSGLVAIHVEKSSNMKKKMNDDKNRREYWSGDDASTKDNYRLGETHGGWQHGLLEFVPLEVHWLTGKENSRQDFLDAASIGQHQKEKKTDTKNSNGRGRVVVDQDRLLFHEKGDVRVGVKKEWKGIRVDAEGDADSNYQKNNGVDALKTPHEYWTYIQRYF